MKRLFLNRSMLFFCIALLYRLGIYFLGPQIQGFTQDSFYYVPVAREIAAGHGIQYVWKWSEIYSFGWGDQWGGQDPEEIRLAKAGHPAFKMVPEGVACKLLLQDPGYSFFLAFWHIVGLSHPTAIVVIQCLLAALLAPAIYTYVLRRAPPSCAAAAALLYALDPIASSTCFFMLREVFVMLVVTTAVFALDMTHRAAPLVKGFLLGWGTVSFALLGLWSNLLWVWDRWLSPRRRAVTISVVLVAWAVFGAWAARNILLSDGNYAFRRHQTALLMYFTALYDFTGLPNVYDEDFKKVWVEASAKAEYGFTVEQRRMEASFVRMTWEVFKADPPKVAWRFVKCNFWFWHEVPGAMEILKNKPVIHIVLRTFHDAQVIFFLLGIAILIRTGTASSFRFVWGTVAYVAIFIFPFMPIPRYYTPFLPLIDIVAAYGAVQVCQRVFSGKR